LRNDKAGEHYGDQKKRLTAFRKRTTISLEQCASIHCILSFATALSRVRRRRRHGDRDDADVTATARNIR
jgi:hypothetical protein